MTETRERYNIEGVERFIQKLLLELDEQLRAEGKQIYTVVLDTRNFATKIKIEEARK